MNGHPSHYKQIITIKVTHNSKSPTIACAGAGFTLKPAFDPPMLDLGAALPAFEGQQPNEAVLKLTNPLDTDMEVIALYLHFLLFVYMVRHPGVCNLLQKHLPRMFALLTNESWGLTHN